LDVFIGMAFKDGQGDVLEEGIFENLGHGDGKT
jgi:hypothetical protein